MAKRDFIVWYNEGSEHGHYSWAVIDGLVFVRTPHGQKVTQVGGSPPEWIARVLAKELGALNRCADC